MIEKETFENLKHIHKMKRRKALDTILSFINELDCDLNSKQSNLFTEFETTLVTCLADESDVNRNKACQILIKLLERKLKSEKLLGYVMPAVYNRIGRTPLFEECEENRLEFLILTEYMIDTYVDDIHNYVNDLCSIFIVCLNDNFPEVILKTCDCITKLGTIGKQKFLMYSNKFLMSLIKCISKHRLKIRIKCINTIEFIFVHGDAQSCEEVMGKLKKCMMDIPQVRQALLSLGHSLCTTMPRRYHFWPSILPFVLFGLRDDDVAIQRIAEGLWKKVGQQYQEEQQDIINGSFSSHFLEGFDQEVQQQLNFNPGCCALIERNFHRMLIQIESDLNDWQPDQRLQAIRLLTVCIAGLVDKNLQYSRNIVIHLIFCVNDNDARVSAESLLCARTWSCIIPPNLYLPLIKPSLWEEKEGSLRLFASFIQGTQPQCLQTDLDLFVDVLRLSNIKKKLSSLEQDELIRIFSRLFDCCHFEKLDAEFLFTLFRIVHAKSSPEDAAGSELALEVLEAAAKSYQAHSVEQFIANYLQLCLRNLHLGSPWSNESENEVAVFCFLSRYPAFGDCLREVTDVLEKKVNHEMFPLVSFTVLQVLMDVLQAVSKRNKELAEEWSIYSIKEFVMKMLPVYQGKTAESLRLAGVSSLALILRYLGSASESVFQALKPCFVHVSNLLKDDIAETRFSSCRFIELYLSSFASHISTQDFGTSIKLLVSGLDDRDVKVRRVAVRALDNSLSGCWKWKAPPEELQALMDSLLIYLLEDDTSIQRGIMGVLEKLAEASPAHFQSLLAHPEHEAILSKMQQLKMAEGKICR